MRALALIDICHIVNYVYCIMLTVLFTQMTADTADGTCSHNIFAFVLRAALYQMLCFVRYQLNQMLRAGSHTFATRLTDFLIYHCNTIYNMDRIKRTRLYAGSVTKAAILTCL